MTRLRGHAQCGEIDLREEVWERGLRGEGLSPPQADELPTWMAFSTEVPLKVFHIQHTAVLNGSRNQGVCGAGFFMLLPSQNQKNCVGYRGLRKTQGLQESTQKCMKKVLVCLGLARPRTSGHKRTSSLLRSLVDRRSQRSAAMSGNF